MALTTIIVIAIFVMLFIILIKFLKGIFKIISAISSLIFITILIFSVFMYVDLYDFNKGVNSEQNAFVFYENNGGFNLLTGVKGTSNSNDISLIENDEINSINNTEFYFNDSFKTWYFDVKIYDYYDSFDVMDFKVPSLTVKNVILGNTKAIDVFVAEYSNRNNAPQDVVKEQILDQYSEKELKAVIIYSSIGKILEDNLDFITYVHDGELKISPNVTAFRVIKFLPIGVVRMFI